MNILQKKKNYKKLLNEWKNILLNKKIFQSKHIKYYWKKIKNYNKKKIIQKQWIEKLLKKIKKYTFLNPKFSKIKKSIIKKFILQKKSYKLIFFNGFLIYFSQNKNKKIYKILKSIKNFSIKSKKIKHTIFTYAIECLNNYIFYIKFLKKKKIKKPIYILYINKGNKKKHLLNNMYYRYYIKIPNNQKINIIEHFVSLNKKKYFIGSRVTIKIGKNSKIEHTKIFSENKKSFHISYHDYYLSKNSYVKHHSIMLGNYLIKNQINSNLEKKQNKIKIYNISIPKKKSLHYIHTITNHKNKLCKSIQLNKIIAQKKTIGIFKGLTLINKIANKNKGYMINKNLLLNNSAEIHSYPKLEIYNNNVTCQHGSATSNINKQHIFYLQSRGIKYKDSIKIIILGFSYKIINKITDKKLLNYIKKYILHLIFKKNEISS